MTRIVNAHERYYTLELSPNLLGEWMLIRTYGSVNNHKPTGEIRKVYETLQEAQESIQILLVVKHKRGYCPKTLNTRSSNGRLGENQC